MNYVLLREIFKSSDNDRKLFDDLQQNLFDKSNILLHRQS